MKFRWVYLVMIIVILCSVSAVSADDLNETSITGEVSDDLILDVLNEPLADEVSDDLADDEDTLAISEDDSLENSHDEDTINISYSEDNAVLANNTESKQESESPLYGIVDLGSNSMELRIYKIKDNGNPEKVFALSQKSVTAIYVENNNLTEKGIDEFVSLMNDFNEVMDIVNVKTKYVFATASLRKIGNAEEAIAAVKNKVGLDIHLLSGEKEADIGFNAIKGTDLTTDDGILIDLGGGSCEVIDFVNKTKITSESMPIGSNSCYKEYVSQLFPNETEIIDIKNRVLSELEKLAVNNTVQRNDLYGIGGTVFTIKNVLIYLGEIDDDADRIPVSMLDELFNELSIPKKENYDIILNVNAQRINTFMPGLIITKTIAEYFNVSYLHFCKSNIEDEILKEVIANETSNKQNVSLNVTDFDLACDENAEIPIALPNNTSGTITVKLDDNICAYSLLNGRCMVVLPKLQSGNHTAEITYSGDENYESYKTKISIHVKSASLDAHDMTRGLKSGYDYQVKLIDENGNAISNKLISFNVLSKQYNVITDDEGIANLKANLAAGTYNVTISSEIAGNATRELKILNRIQNNKNLNVYYASNAKYKVRIIGDDGTPVGAGQSVRVLIDNKLQIIKTDKSGFITFTINKNFKVGKHTVEICYKGANTKNKITVKHLVTLKSASVKKSAKKLILTASLAKVNGKYLKNKQITFKFNGKTYKSKTNSKGIAKVTIKSTVLKKLKVGKKVAYHAAYLKDTVKKTVKVKK